MDGLSSIGHGGESSFREGAAGIMVRGHVDVVGTDASGLEGLSVAWRRRLLEVDWVAAPSRFHGELTRARAALARPPRLLATDRPEALLPTLRDLLEAGQQGLLLASGDPLWFGIGRFLLDSLPASCLSFHPAPTSLQLAFARLGRPWQDAQWLSLHGRDPEPLADALKRRPAALAILTDPGPGSAETARRGLVASGLAGSYALWVCERLGHPQERVRRLSADQPLPADLDPLHLVVLLAEPPEPPEPASLPLFGLEDGLWLQASDHPGLMTKREVRIQLLADLELPPTGVLWDVGAGVGSVGLEALRLRPQLELWAVERRLGAAALIEANARRLGVKPTAVVEGVAPAACADWPAPDRVLIGGAGKHRRQVVEAASRVLRPGGRIVVPLATLEAMAELRGGLDPAHWQVAVSQLQVWRGVPLADGTRLAPLNPVFVLKAWRVGTAIESPRGSPP
ncbi:MAG: precorrin-6y C5,15-methyltransferase (decarboxylating) subunit CbiE [Cyanobacteriota bacterium]|nr:precorrin-6y C5,15-methyltransferase (decarboxylating) subunit CbiE [Cyanobacteriota bacterium]